MPLSPPIKKVSSYLSNFASVLLHENFTEFEGFVDNHECVCGLLVTTSVYVVC